MTAPAPSILNDTRRFVERSDISARSLLVTAWGDTIRPVADSIWLSDLFGLMEPFPFSERLLRTSLSRLQADDWVVAERDGRRARYELTDNAEAETAEAETVIYGSRPGSWDGAWLLVFFDEQSELDELRTKGFGLLRPGVAGKPATTSNVIVQSGLDALTVASARFATDIVDSEDSLALMFDLDPIAVAYQDFIDRYRCFASDSDAAGAPADAFAVRTMAIHEYRRIRLRDPLLPTELGPQDWVGDSAERLVAELYGRLSEPSWEWATTAIDPSHQPASWVWSRFAADAS